MNYIYSLLKNNINLKGHFIDENNKMTYEEMNLYIITLANKLKEYEDGFLYVVGRIDNMCNYAGKNVYLEEIESIIMAYPKVLEVLVTPIFNDDEIVGFKAYVVMSEKSLFDYKRIFDHCVKNIDIYKVPKEIIYIDSLEKTASGKIKRQQSFMENKG